jgi:SHS2 domain-containing protein
MYRWVEHPAELELSVQASSEAEVFADGVAALAELLGAEPGGETESRRISLHASDRTVLFADWLGELAFLAESEDFVAERLDALDLRHDSLEAAVEGRRGRPPHLVKAVTYHDLEFERANGAWRARAVLDV